MEQTTSPAYQGGRGYGKRRLGCLGGYPRFSLGSPGSEGSIQFCIQIERMCRQLSIEAWGL